MKFLVAIAVSLFTTVALAQSPINDSTSATYSGSVAKTCLIQQDLTSSDLQFADTNGDSFSDKFSGSGAFSYQTNTACKITTSTNFGLQGGTQNNATSKPCSLPGDVTEASVSYTQDPVLAGVSFDFSNAGKPLPAGSYSVTCTVNITAL